MKHGGTSLSCSFLSQNQLGNSHSSARSLQSDAGGQLTCPPPFPAPFKPPLVTVATASLSLMNLGWSDGYRSSIPAESTRCSHSSTCPDSTFTCRHVPTPPTPPTPTPPTASWCHIHPEGPEEVSSNPNPQKSPAASTPASSSSQKNPPAPAAPPPPPYLCCQTQSSGRWSSSRDS